VKGAVVHRSRDLCWGHVMVRDGILVTTAPITALDLGVVLGARELAEVVVRARQLKLFEPPVLRAMVAKLGRPGRTGIRTVRAALDLVMIGDRPADSVLELRFAFLAHDHGLPPFEYQHSVRINGKRFDIDFAFPAVRLAIEVDGYESRRSSASLDYDDHRGNLLVLDGWTLLRFTWSQVCNAPAAVAGQILAALGKLGYHFGR
jgi:very-short-patch-repair endonuclease